MATADIISSVIIGGVNNHTTSSEEANAYATDFVSPGVVGTISNTSGVSPATGSFAVNQDSVPAMSIAVTAGVAYVQGTPSGQASQVVRAKQTANTTGYTINANSSGSTRYDWIYLSFSAANAAAPSASANNVITLVTSRSTSNVSDNGTPPTYGTLLAVITVANGASSITNANITDRRTQTALAASATANNTGWTGLGYTPNSITYNGNRSYSLVFNSLDLTGTVSAGYRLRFTRNNASPTQCTSLNGTTQYWVKTSPNKLTFTDDFLTLGWVKLTSYAQSAIISRYNGTSGWTTYVLSTGQIRLEGTNAGAANFSNVTSTQSLPLNKWVHVTAQLDMSAFTATTTTSYVMFDGIDVPASVSRGGTNPTALVQAGNLEVGSTNGGTNLFPGKLAQVGVFNAKITQATIQGYISQGLAGTETSLASAYSFNNAVTDLNTTTPNDLSVGGGAAVATNADSPFGVQASGLISSTLDYGIIQSVTFSTNTTVVVDVAEANSIPTSPTSSAIGAISYASDGNPYGFPGKEGKFTLITINNTSVSQSSPVANTQYNLGNLKLKIPIGDYIPGYIVNLAATCSSASTSNFAVNRAAMSTSTSSVTDIELYSKLIGNNTTFLSAPSTKEKKTAISQTSATDWYLIASTDTTATSAMRFDGDLGSTVLYARNAWL